MRKRLKVHITSLGCEKNLVDAEALAGSLKSGHIEIVSEPEAANCVIVNTCGFIQSAKEESIDAILEAAEMKKKGLLDKVIVAGCLSARYTHELPLELPEVDSFFGTEKFNDIAAYLGNKHSISMDRVYSKRILSGQPHSAYLKISEGCDHHCSFCAIPSIRGQHRSRTPEQIIEEAEMLAANGARELILIAQDSTYWGRDLANRQTINDLLNELEKIHELRWLRVMYLYPQTIPKGYFQRMAQSEKHLAYADIPLQHASSRMLKLMRRGGSRQQLHKLLATMRQHVPEITIRTTFIVGHPGETEADFAELLAFIEEEKLHRVGAFTFSPEENTHSYTMDETVSEDVKNQRYAMLMETQRHISQAHNEAQVGREMEVIIDEVERSRKLAFGRSRADAPDIDNEIMLHKPEDIHLEKGSFVRAKITSAFEYELVGDYLCTLSR
jgi:ribosomal protein S12 methylthiotransferase